ncbi:hypothetical protein GOBAR_AA09190 [Gossypium barbadense]|uniref:Uncharacterized protein n=1 Tax=Gossypium barbadense TaxID=3634 RepID=A0A2P5Y7B8_GOSBA|nr:hypothetical protein GOBAR_AA09190 [Gossypium barbadense]
MKYARSKTYPCLMLHKRARERADAFKRLGSQAPTVGERPSQQDEGPELSQPGGPPPMQPSRCTDPHQGVLYEESGKGPLEVLMGTIERGGVSQWSHLRMSLWTLSLFRSGSRLVEVYTGGAREGALARWVWGKGKEVRIARDFWARPWDPPVFYDRVGYTTVSHGHGDLTHSMPLPIFGKLKCSFTTV